jgi:hypothetical protein
MLRGIFYSLLGIAIIWVSMALFAKSEGWKRWIFFALVIVGAVVLLQALVSVAEHLK